MKNITIITCILLTANTLFAQHARFITGGSITFEKTVNIYGLIKEHYGTNPDAVTLKIIDQYKESQPQFKKYTASLAFNHSKTLYTPDPAEDEEILMNNYPTAKSGNLVYTDLSSNTFIAQKNIYDNIFLVKDSTRKIKWKFTSETREIAGYTCRRANALVMDSVYVVAFYTDKIHVSGGPESFTGLPGMILGIALPHENVTWFATKVTDTDIAPNTIAPPKKGKQLNDKQLSDFLHEKMKTWGANGRYEMKVFLL